MVWYCSKEGKEEGSLRRGDPGPTLLTLGVSNCVMVMVMVMMRRMMVMVTIIVMMMVVCEEMMDVPRYSHLAFPTV
jgi:hypothetical protein